MTGPRLVEPMTVTFDAPGGTLSMNQRVHWRARHRHDQLWKHAAHTAACAQLGRGPSLRIRGACFVRVTFPVPDPGRRRDPHNLAPTVKAIVDGLVLAGVWPDDNERWVSVLDPRFAKCDRGRIGTVTVALSPRAGELPG